jgi:hypothetical protein
MVHSARTACPTSLILNPNEAKQCRMKWRASTLRKAAELQAEIGHLQRSLGELLQATEVKVTAPTRVDGRVRKASSQKGSLCSEAINVPKAKGVSGDVLEILDELLFWGNEFNSSEPKTARFAHIYRWKGLKPIDRDRFVSAE